MPTNLPCLVPATDPNNRAVVQDTEFTTDALGRFLCITWDGATRNGGVAFDAVVIGAGMFGAHCAKKIYRHAIRRVLVLDAGSLLITEHVQNLARTGVNAGGEDKVKLNSQDTGPREVVWGSPWRSRVPFPGLAYCPGGRSLYWGGWAPRLTTADLNQWPAEARTYLTGAYADTDRETGGADTTDYFSGARCQELPKKVKSVKAAVPTGDKIEDASLAVQAAAPASGLFSFDNWSSAPILCDDSKVQFTRLHIKNV